MARGCPIRTRWRSGRSNHRAESGAGRSSHGSLVPAQRLAHQPRRTRRSGLPSRHDSTEHRHDLVAAERRRAACAGWAAPPRRAVTTCRMGWRRRARPGMAFGCVPPARGWTRWRSDARPATAFEGAARDCVPTRMAVGCGAWDGVRGRSRCWPVQARDAFPVMAVGCLIRARWRSGRGNHRVESGVGVPSHGLLVPAQRLAHQPRRPKRSVLRSC
jgi:hypothetical protein